MSTDQTNFSNNMLEDTSKPTNDNILEDTSKAKSDKGLRGAHEDASQQSQKDDHVQGEVVEDKQELEAEGDHEPVKAIDNEAVADGVDEEQVIQSVDNEAVANEEPISENKEEDLTSLSDDQDPATMLPHDQQLPEDPQVTYEGGAASGTPNTPSHSSPSVDSALAGGASPGVDAQADLDQYYSLISSEIPFSSLLGNESSSFVPSGNHHNQQYFQQILYSQLPTMAQENNNNNTRTNPSMLFPLDQTPIRNLDSGSGSSAAFGSQNMHRHQSNTSHMMVQPLLDNGNTAAFMRSTNQPPTIFGGEDLHFQRFFQSQAAGSFGGQQIPQLHSIPAQQHGIMTGNFAGGHPYPVAEVARTPRMTMNNWEDNINMAAPTPNLHVPNRAHWSTQLGQASQGPNYGNSIIPNAPASKPIKNSLYDPMYEAMGLPVDPHLRLFLGMQRRNNGTFGLSMVTCSSSNGREPDSVDGVKSVERLLEEKRRAELSARIASGEFTVEKIGYPSQLKNGLSKLGVPREIVDFLFSWADAHDGSPKIPEAKGEIRAIQNEAFFIPLYELYLTYGGIYRLTFGPKSFLIVSDPSIAKHILRDNSKAYSKGILAEILEFVMGKGLIPADGEIWRVRRRAIVPALHQKYVAAMIKLFGEATERLCQKLDAAASDGEDVEMESLFSRLTLDIIGKALFNYDFDSLTDDTGIVEAVYTVLREAEDRSVAPIPVWEIPIWKDISPRQRKVATALKLINTTLDDLIAICKRMVDEEELQFHEEYMNEQDPSVLHFLLASGDDVSSKQLRDDLMTKLIAGHETSAAVLTWTFYLLSTVTHLRPSKATNFSLLCSLVHSNMDLHLRLTPRPVTGNFG
ncbi:unnamed protein product [Prunus armeniaca]|uniref:Cytochrome P450 n=1 Tax=Prunus armeniaca TaxID=36596 RepID=A0A6J5VCV5_PRUAR|nr:unnamed protein product [Prunus armeniaca]